jgi:hypothetical protein
MSSRWLTLFFEQESEHQVQSKAGICESHLHRSSLGQRDRVDRRIAADKVQDVI